GRLGFAATAAGGLLGPPIAALGLFLASRSPTASRRALAAFLLLLVVALVLWMRNLFGLFFVGSLCALLGLLLWKGGRLAQLVTAFLAMQLSLSVFSRSDYLFTSQAETAGGPAPSDTAQIADALFLPFWIWGSLIALLSLAILWVGLLSVARAMR
ncbi:MAG: M50 family metallopeptidase, partial [Panacagrimonas sp.]